MTLLLVFVSYAIVLSVALARAGYRSRAAPPPGIPRDPPARVLIVGATGVRLVALPPGGMCNYKVKLETAAEVDAPLIAWIKKAFDGAARPQRRDP